MNLLQYATPKLVNFSNKILVDGAPTCGYGNTPDVSCPSGETPDNITCSTGTLPDVGCGGGGVNFPPHCGTGNSN
ncbi:MAG: hypothetical protein WC636_03375 [Candidatus Margulisiibacteriota bacterium]